MDRPRLDVDVLVTIGPKFLADELGRLPTNVRNESVGSSVHRVHGPFDAIGKN